MLHLGQVLPPGSWFSTCLWRWSERVNDLSHPAQVQLYFLGFVEADIELVEATACLILGYTSLRKRSNINLQWFDGCAEENGLMRYSQCWGLQIRKSIVDSEGKEGCSGFNWKNVS